MQDNKNMWKRVVLLCLCFLLLPCSVFAYIDPGTGSYALQVLIAGFVAGLFVIKQFWNRIIGFFKGVSRKKERDG
ncbi:MAG: hypothetical protein JRF30_07405 [Deltaproteobacteria bacterium]|nr:hypothetical protein [Deltaproteobacteria bacterium]MBW2330739.1 hypothetical protein [Deltaproteobacteria bacterium]